MKKLMDYCLGKNQKKQKFYHVALGATIGGMLGIALGMIMKDKKTCEKIKNTSVKLAKDASNALCTAKKIIIHKANNCSCKKPNNTIVELFTDEE